MQPNDTSGRFGAYVPLVQDPEALLTEAREIIRKIYPLETDEGFLDGRSLQRAEEMRWSREFLHQVRYRRSVLIDDLPHAKSNQVDLKTPV